MKRFLVFYGYSFYPSGGMEDFSNDYESLEEAIKKLKLMDELHIAKDNWGHIWDSNEREIVFELNDNNHYIDNIND